MILSLPHPTLYDGEADTLRIPSGDSTRIDGYVIKAELNLSLIGKLLHLALHGIQHITVEGSVLQVMVINDFLMVLAVSEDTEEFLEVNIVDITGADPAPGAQIYV